MTSTQHARMNDGSAETSMLSLVYTSTASTPFSEMDLALLLAVSRANNEPSAVTGVLLYRDGRFLQALEGPEGEVRRTLARIAADPRHTDLHTHEELRTEERRFGSWAMGYQSGADARSDAATWFGSPEALVPSIGSKTSELLTAFRR